MRAVLRAAYRPVPLNVDQGKAKESDILAAAIDRMAVAADRLSRELGRPTADRELYSTMEQLTRTMRK